MVGSRHQKKLHIIRHGKAKSPHQFADDFDRPLHKTGIVQAHIVGHYLKYHQRNTSIALCSEALRTKQTFQIVQEICGIDQCLFLGNLYLASAATLLQATNMLNNDYQEALIVGHNDGLSDFVSRLSGKSIYLQTCDYVELTFEVNSWDVLHWDMGVVTDEFRPQLVDV
jgi:phosphohistidine phosphatase